jgi:hypothetical protein
MPSTPDRNRIDIKEINVMFSMENNQETQKERNSRSKRDW